MLSYAKPLVTSFCLLSIIHNIYQQKERKVASSLPSSKERTIVKKVISSGKVRTSFLSKESYSKKVISLSNDLPCSKILQKAQQNSLERCFFVERRNLIQREQFFLERRFTKLEVVYYDEQQKQQKNSIMKQISTIIQAKLDFQKLFRFKNNLAFQQQQLNFRQRQLQKLIE